MTHQGHGHLTLQQEHHHGGVVAALAAGRMMMEMMTFTNGKHGRHPLHGIHGRHRLLVVGRHQDMRVVGFPMVGITSRDQMMALLLLIIKIFKAEVDLAVDDASWQKK